MVRNAFLLSGFLAIAGITKAQEIQVPMRVECVGIELTFTESLRNELQTEVNALIRNPKYLQVKLERAQQYFPIIEQVFREENVPEEIKYLALQESALIADAVSTSEAVGFWQFKLATAQDLGLRVDQHVDERMNIISSSRAAARYLKSNNFFYNNWIYAILAYNTGRGGAEAYVQPKYFGAKKMELDQDLFWYIKKFLAHFIAFRVELNRLGTPEMKLSQYTLGAGKSLAQISRETGVPDNEISLYNKWLIGNRIPEDKTYVVIVPGTFEENRIAENNPQVLPVEETGNPSPNSAEYPKIGKSAGNNPRIVRINGIKGIIAREDDNFQSLARIASLAVNRFVKINDLNFKDKIVKGQVYYFRPKHGKAREYYHTLMPGENLWEVSQKYGIRLKGLWMKNRLNHDQRVRPGLVLWIRYIRPSDIPEKYVTVPPVEIVKESDSARVNNDPGKILMDSAVLHQLNSSPQTDTLQKPMSADTSKSATIAIDTLKPPETVTDTLVHNHNQPSGSADLKTPLFHLVVKGETLYSISKVYGITLKAIMDLNDIPENGTIRIGQQIYLREPPEEILTKPENHEDTTESYMSYTVLQGETLFSISKKFNVTVQELLNWNGKNNNQLKTGEILKIRKRPGR